DADARRFHSHPSSRRRPGSTFRPPRPRPAWVPAFAGTTREGLRFSRKRRRALMFSKILIANRGEIACRVIRTARRMGIATVAVYSKADASALHVALADEVRLLRPPPARDSYLDIERI